MADRKKFRNPGVARVFAAYPAGVRKKLMSVRQLIFDVAARTTGVGELEETLKWGQPSYLTMQTGSGSTIRIDQVRQPQGGFAVYFHCRTTLVDTFREMFDDELEFQGNRAIVFGDSDRIPKAALRHCIELALTYHLDKT
jgi:hypothetical protein